MFALKLGAAYFDYAMSYNSLTTPSSLSDVMNVPQLKSVIAHFITGVEAPILAAGPGCQQQVLRGARNRERVRCRQRHKG